MNDKIVLISIDVINDWGYRGVIKSKEIETLIRYDKQAVLNALKDVKPLRYIKGKGVSFMQIKTKVCSKCGKEKSVNCFGRKKRNRDGLYNYCKECKRLDNKTHYEKNKAKILEQQKKYYETNKDAIQKKSADYRSLNSDKIKIKNKESYIKRVEKAKSDPVYANHLKEINKRSVAKWQENNKEHLREYRQKRSQTERHKQLKKKSDTRYQDKLKRERPEELARQTKARNSKKRGGLQDVYIVSLIRQSSGITSDNIRKYPELIEAKRQQLKIKRICRI